MLVGFRVTNHRSFRDEQEMSFLPVYDKSRAALPVAGVFGANASGKSSLLDALRFVRDAVVGSYVGWDPLGGVPRRPFRLDPAAAARPSTFAVDLVLDGVRHMYGFVVDDTAVREEWLYTSPRGRRRVLFERAGQEVRFGPTFDGPKLAVVELTRPNSLFLSAAAQAGHQVLTPLFDWFRSRVHFIDARAARPFVGADTSLLVPSRLMDRVVELVRAADLGIVDVRLRGAGAPTEPGPRVSFLHRAGSGTVELGEEDEAEGTLRWITLLVPVAAALEAGSVLAVDELDVSLHPFLTTRLVRLFREAASNPEGAQLIFASHDSTLLGGPDGVPTLGRDEIWFVEKDDEGASVLYPLSDFRSGRHEDLERRYLSGLYGAVPLLAGGGEG